MRYLIANWKMNLPPEGVERYLGSITKKRSSDVNVVVAPPFPFLMDVHGVRLAGQNCSEHQSGAFTGEVSARMLQDCGAEMVILGHSERRTLFHENDAIIARKLGTAIDTGLAPVLCIGEDLKVRDSGQVARFLADQIKASAVESLATVQEIVIAYEPVWAIGTGRNASGQMVAETLVEIRHAVERFWPARLAKTSILYGGSVTPDNVADLVDHGTIDGFLVGGASLDSSKFLAVLEGLDGKGESGKNSHP